jgi:hypothetical protein
MSVFDDLRNELTAAIQSIGNTVGVVQRAGDHVRHSIGDVLLEAVSTHSAVVCGLRVELAVQVAQRLPFATPQSICADAFGAAKDSARYVPYFVTADTFLGGLVAAGAMAGTGTTVLALAAPAVAGLSVAKAAAILVLLADLPTVDPADLPQFASDLGTQSDKALEIAQGLFERLATLVPIAGWDLSAGDLEEGLSDLKEELDEYLAASASSIAGGGLIVLGLLAGIPKVFNAATRGANRVLRAIEAQQDLLCGQGRQPARAFYRRHPNVISLDRTYPAIIGGDTSHDSWAVLAADGVHDVFKIEGTAERSRAEFALSTKTTELALERVRATALKTSFATAVRATSVFADSKELTVVGRPVETVVGGDTIVLDTEVPDLLPNQPLAFSGQRPDTHEQVSEIALLGPSAAAVTADGERTTVVLAAPLREVYERSTLRINANVAVATHGESVRELLGSSSAAVAHQRVALKQAPVTHVSADNASGCRSTLDVRVNDLAWREVPTLVGRGPAERVFTTSTDDNGRTTVMFGDGIEGAIPPSGQSNLRASYRKGLGHDGNVEANRLTSLLTRPAGVARVSNPDAASGGDDPESIEAARRNAPVTVLTLDRAVSIRDYEDFARTFAGIAKASAIWTPAGPGRGVFLTVVGPKGDPVPPNGDTARKLIASLRKWGDPLLPLRVASRRLARFRVSATIKVAPEAVTEKVLVDVRAALQSAFSVDARELAQPVSIGEVISVMHRANGVVAVDIDALYRSATPAWNAMLAAAPASVRASGAAKAAELLLIDASAINLGVMP